MGHGSRYLIFFLLPLICLFIQQRHVFLLSVENENHCDFVKLREMLIRTNMEDLRETTHIRHYEIYRRLRLEQVLDLLLIL